jgi:hypothetical protein
LTTVESALAVVNDPLFKALLETILAYVNYLNSGTKRECLGGIKLADLMKIGDVRSSNEKDFTLAHMIMRAIGEKYPDFARYLSSAKCIHAAAKCTLIYFCFKGDGWVVLKITKML